MFDFHHLSDSDVLQSLLDTCTHNASRWQHMCRCSDTCSPDTAQYLINQKIETKVAIY